MTFITDEALLVSDEAWRMGVHEISTPHYDMAELRLFFGGDSLELFKGNSGDCNALLKEVCRLTREHIDNGGELRLISITASAKGANVKVAG